eukprot:TRINITY_DN26710_c0_g1_i1.p1 TRINITY_DN26710_c0_g1~~TRINITY_DN26710_c0_g1_i1.p1  ORF type:complete len:249 (-),score=30.75 TRINITY_DN26710_c0_g1_i1:52-798(-)
MLQSVCGVDMSALEHRLAKEEASEPAIQGLEPDQLLGQPRCLLDLDLRTTSLQQIESISATLQWWDMKSAPRRKVDGIGCWFEVLFEPPPAAMWSAATLLALPSLSARFSAASPECDDRKGNESTNKSAAHGPRRTVVLTTAPAQARTCWHQTLLYLPTDQPFCSDAPLRAEISLSRPSENRRHLRIKGRFSTGRREDAAGRAANEEDREVAHTWLLRTYAEEGVRAPPLPVARVRGTSRAASYGGAC